MKLTFETLTLGEKLEVSFVDSRLPTVCHLLLPSSLSHTLSPPPPLVLSLYVRIS